jgi:hypothetical protein
MEGLGVIGAWEVEGRGGSVSLIFRDGCTEEGGGTAGVGGSGDAIELTVVADVGGGDGSLPSLNFEEADTVEQGVLQDLVAHVHSLTHTEHISWSPSSRSLENIDRGRERLRFPSPTVWE